MSALAQQTWQRSAGNIAKYCTDAQPYRTHLVPTSATERAKVNRRQTGGQTGPQMATCTVMTVDVTANRRPP